MRSYSYFLIILLFFIPIVFDLLYGFLNVFLSIDFPISSIFRSFLLILTAPYIVKQRKNKIHLYFFTVLIFFLLSLFIWTIGFGNEFFLREVEYFIRIMYPFFLVFFLIFIFKKYEDDLVQQVPVLLISAGLLASGSIFFSYFTGFGIQTYGDYAFGISSFFNAANDISLSLILAINLSMYLLMVKGKLKYLFLSVFMLISLILLGTRAGIFGGTGTILFYSFFIVISQKFNRIKPAKRISILIVVVLAGFFILSKAIEKISEYSYLVEKYQKVLVESPRAKLEDAGMKAIENRGFETLLIGEGSVPFGFEVERNYSSSKAYKYGKLVEQDILDMIGSYGLILGSLILVFPLLLFIKAINLNIRGMNAHTIFLLTSISIFIVHSFLAGHAIDSPTVAMYISYVYFAIIYYKRLYRNEKF